MQKKFFCMLMSAIFLISSVVMAAEIQGNGFIEVEGIKYFSNDINPVTGKPYTLDELRRMAVVDGYRILAEELGDLHISAVTIMKNAMLDDTVKTEVEKTIRNSKVTVTRDSENNFYAKVRLNLYGGANSIANIVVPKDTKVEPFPKFNPKFETIDSNYTGLIIDLSGQEVSTAILPKIKSVSGKEVYAFQFLNRNVVVSRGMVNYSDGSNNSRAGNNPLTIQAMFVEDCDVVVSDDDAEKILAANSKSNFLKNCMVVFVK